MKRLLLFGLLAATITVAVAQVTHSYASGASSKIGDKHYESTIDTDMMNGMPLWDTSKPLPLSFAHAERIARAELRKLTDDEAAWEVAEFALERVPKTQSWYYSVQLRPTTLSRTNYNFFEIYILPDGKPCRPEPRN